MLYGLYSATQVQYCISHAALTAMLYQIAIAVSFNLCFGIIYCLKSVNLVSCTLCQNIFDLGGQGVKALDYRPGVPGSSPTIATGIFFSPRSLLSSAQKSE